MICCSCLVLVNCQLADQLPGGKFYLPSEEIVTETGLCPRTNILSERHFAQMDRKVCQKPNISTVGASGVILFLNNQTYDWLQEMDDIKLDQLITKVIRMAPSYVKLFKEKRKKIRAKRTNSQHRVRMEKEVARQTAADEKAALAVKLKKWDGFWETAGDVDEHMVSLTDAKRKQALKDQINYRKLVLQQTHPDPKIFNAGTTVEGRYQQYSVIKLSENLKEIIQFNQQAASDRANEIQNPEIRPEEERRRRMNEVKKDMKESPKAKVHDKKQKT